MRNEKSRNESFERLIGVSIHLQRDAVNMSQKELADRLSEFGFSIQQSAIAKIEKGTRPLRVSELVGIAHALGIPWQSLMVAGENYGSFAKDPVARLQERINANSLLSEAMMESELRHIKEFLEQYTEILGNTKAAEQLLGRMRLTDPKEIEDAVQEILAMQSSGDNASKDD